jgi:putative hydrolase of the HAD superfamily
MSASAGWPAISAILFDVDDTLLDTRAAMVAAGEAAAAALWPEAGPGVHHGAGVHFHRDPDGIFGRFTTGELSFAQMRQARVADLLEFVALAPPDEAFQRFGEVYEPAFLSSLRVFDDVVPVLEALSSLGMPAGVLTNSSSAYASQKLEVTGLAGFFAVVATRDTLGFGKPDARAFQHACRLMGTAPSETLYVGDHLEVDAIAAKDAGLSALWLDRDAVNAVGPADAVDLPDAAEPVGAAGALGSTGATSFVGRVRAEEHGIPVVRSLSQVPGLLADL